MDWDTLIAARKQTLNFNPFEPVDWDNIQKLMDSLHRYLPSKQNQCPYKIDVLGWSNPDLRLAIFSKTIPPDDQGNENNPQEWNPQTLAPILFCISSVNNVSDGRSARTEIGMVGLFITYAALDLGYHIGFCGCINDGVAIAKLLGHKTKIETQLLIGIGIEDCENNPRTVNPNTGIITSKPRDLEFTKPKISSYCKICP
jgi:hypothetical protein